MPARRFGSMSLYLSSLSRRATMFWNRISLPLAAAAFMVFAVGWWTQGSASPAAETVSKGAEMGGLDRKDSVRLYPIVRKGRLGLIDAAGREVLPPLYESLAGMQIDVPRPGIFPPLSDILWFLEGIWNHPVTAEVFPFSRDGLWGFMDRRSRVVVEGRFLKAEAFGTVVPLAPVRTESGWGFIDREGRFVIEPRFEDASRFMGAAAPVKEGGRWGLIGPDGKYLSDSRFDEEPHIGYRPGVERDLVPALSAGKWGWIDETGRFVIPPKFESKLPLDGREFKEGLANMPWQGKMGFIDLTGNFVIEPVYDVAGPFLNGLAVVSTGGKCGYVDREGKSVIPMLYERCWPFFDSLARVATGRKWGFVDRSGKVVVELGRYDSADVMEEGFAVVEHKGKAGYIGADGALAIPMKFDGGKNFSEGLAPAVVGRKWGYIDPSGALVIEPQFTRAMTFKGDLAVVEIKKAIGYVDRTGKTVHVTPFSELVGP